MVGLLVANSSQPSVAFHILTRPNQMTGFLWNVTLGGQGVKKSQSLCIQFKGSYM